MDVEAELDRVFALPPDEFVAARDDLVKQLRAEQRRDEASAVKSLRRPTVSAWAVNQIALRHPDRLHELLESGAAVAAAQRRALSGVRETGLREAMRDRRDTVTELVDLAAGMLAEAGTDPGPHRQAVAATLEVASADPDTADQITRGRLAKELSGTSGFGELTGFSLVDTGDDDPDGAAADDRDEAAAARREEAARAQAAAAALAEEAANARRDAVRAAADAERAQRAARQAGRSAEEAAARADDLSRRADLAAEQAAALAAAIDCRNA